MTIFDFNSILFFIKVSLRLRVQYELQEQQELSNRIEILKPNKMEVLSYG